jgi:hypothetical protein
VRQIQMLQVCQFLMLQFPVLVLVPLALVEIFHLLFAMG